MLPQRLRSPYSAFGEFLDIWLAKKARRPPTRSQEAVERVEGVGVGSCTSEPFSRL